MFFIYAVKKYDLLNMIKQSLEQKLEQKLTPQQIQMIKLLELPILELEQRVKQELEDKWDN